MEDMKASFYIFIAHLIFEVHIFGRIQVQLFWTMNIPLNFAEVSPFYKKQKKSTHIGRIG
jgi:hypothetical protein